ncbi:MAG: response regulator [Nitrospinota bacterium]
MESDKRKTVLIAEDHPIFRRGLIDLIESDGIYDIVCKVDNGTEALSCLKEYKPDVAILDISLPEMSGLDVVSKAIKEKLKVKFIILTMYTDKEYFNKAMELGVEGYILKENTEDNLLEGLKAVLSGNSYVSPILSTYLLDKVRRASSNETHATLKDLTPSELNIVRLISENMTSKEIAKKLFISHKTVENHRTNICAKLALKGKNQLIRYAVENRSLLTKPL